VSECLSWGWFFARRKRRKNRKKKKRKEEGKEFADCLIAVNLRRGKRKRFDDSGAGSREHAAKRGAKIPRTRREKKN